MLHLVVQLVLLALGAFGVVLVLIALERDADEQAKEKVEQLLGPAPQYPGPEFRRPN